MNQIRQYARGYSVYSVALFLLLVACAEHVEEGDTSVVNGLVAEVYATSLTKTEWFSLEVGSGSMIKVIVNKDLGEFTPSHLRSHMITGEPVEVTFIKKQNGEGTIVAVSVRDYE